MLVTQPLQVFSFLYMTFFELLLLLRRAKILGLQCWLKVKDLDPALPGRKLDFSVQEEQAHLLEFFVQEFLFLSQQGLVWTSWACPDWTRCLLFLRLLLAGLLLDPLAGLPRTKLWERK